MSIRCEPDAPPPHAHPVAPSFRATVSGHIMTLRSSKHWPHCPSACGIRPSRNSGFLQPSESTRLPIAHPYQLSHSRPRVGVLRWGVLPCTKWAIQMWVQEPQSFLFFQ